MSGLSFLCALSCLQPCILHVPRQCSAARTVQRWQVQPTSRCKRPRTPVTADRSRHTRHKKEHPASHSPRGTLNTIIRINIIKPCTARVPSLRGVSKELLTDHVLRDAFLPCAPGAVEAHFGSPQAADSATGAVAAAASAAPVAQEVLTLDPAHPSHGAFGPGISGVPPPVVPR